MVFLAHNDKTQTWPPLLICAIPPSHDRGHSRNLHVIDLRKLAFGDAVSVEDDPFGVNLVLEFEPLEEFLSSHVRCEVSLRVGSGGIGRRSTDVKHVFQVFDHLKPGVLNARY